MRIGHVVLRVSDIDRAVAFWRDRVGLSTDWSGGEFAFLKVGETDTYLALNQPVSFTEQWSETEVVFELDDVVAAYTQMRERGVPFEVEPRAVTSDGSRSLLAAHFRDPDGHLASISGWVDGAEEA